MNRTEILDLPVRHRPGRAASLAALFAAAATLAGCGGGAETVENPVTTPPPTSNYNGPPPANADVQAFKLNIWDHLRTSNRCGSCHGTGGQVPQFVRDDDVNLAYQEAAGLADLTQPSDSRFVTKVGGGHNCWLTSAQACADIITTWIEAWAGDQAAGGRTIQLQAPVLKDAGASKSFPSGSALFGSTVYPLLTQFCAGCHAQGAATPQAPFFADGDVDAAYEEVKSKIALDDPASSRLVVRLRDEFHNCWTASCANDATTMQNAIESFAGNIQPTQVDPSLVVSKALTMFDGTLAAGGNRYENSQIALWEFKTGQGNTAFDTSGVDPALNLTLSGNVSWFGGWGIDIKGGKAQGSTTASKKLHDMIKATGEYAVEAWVVPGNVVQEEARIVSYSAGTMARNFSLMQTLYNYEVHNRSSVTDANGQPFFATPDAEEVLQATLQHVVVTYSPVDGRRIYVNGELRADADPQGGGTLTDWDDTFALVLGNEVSGDRQFVGVLRLVAVHNRTLTLEQIQQNFTAGVGEKFFLLFSVEHLISVPDSYVMFQVSQFDSYAYLFEKPTFISLDSSVTPDGIPLAGVRIGVNGQEAATGQTYATLDTMISAMNYTPEGQLLSTLGAVIGLEKGPASDEFFLSFEVLGANTNVRTPSVPIAPPPVDLPEMPDIGVRTFDEINATMAEVTWVSPTQVDVQQTYLIIKQSLPTVEHIETFASAHQVAISQLAIEYCNALVEDPALRSGFFPGFNFAASASQAFDTAAERDQVIDPLLANIIGTGLGSQPADAATRGELNNLIDRLTACGGGCAVDRTETVVKAACAAVLGSGAMLVQ